MNLVIHSTNGGVLRVQVEPHRILMQTSDDGPGIADVQQALQPGWSTASQEARSMGFGAGMGLVNIKRCVDKMVVDSTLGKGTKLLMEIHLRPEQKFKAPPGASEMPGV
jgi:anti-sigma regulatory factor (Ser/Thr protein kinase)